MYVFLKSETTSFREATAYLFTVGFYDPDGKWIAESDHDMLDEAAARVNYLNGGRGGPGFCLVCGNLMKCGCLDDEQADHAKDAAEALRIGRLPKLQMDDDQ